MLAVGIGTMAMLCNFAVCAADATAAGLEEVVVTSTREIAAADRAEAASVGTVTREQLDNRPLLRPGEVLEAVPGLVVSQHSGDGKANQYFLRGFNLDHGTDFATWVDGVPVNMPTHAHGRATAISTSSFRSSSSASITARASTTPKRATSQPPAPPGSTTDTASMRPS
jgi:outer membrane cobalamin receptor